MSLGTTAGIPGIGGFLNLRHNFDKVKQEIEVQNQNKQRHQGYLKELLAKKFYTKYGLHQLGDKNYRI